jgi:ribosomal protein S18 acetylase RimI-like enzyme
MIQELKWDSELFGRKIGRVVPVTDDSTLKNLIAEAREGHYRYLGCRVPAQDIAIIRLFESNGFYLTDLGIVFERGTEGAMVAGGSAREGTLKDVDVIKKIAKGLFRGGRFYTDPFFSEEEADSLYQAWAENSLRGFADRVFLVEEKGFITCKVSGETGNIPLIGVTNKDQGRGIGAVLVLNALNWFERNNVKLVTVRTQAGNSRALKFYWRLGFCIRSADISMGKILAPW